MAERYLNTAYLLIGGNVGNKHLQLEIAKKLLNEQCGNIKTVSSIYKTAAWGIEKQDDFLNQAIKIDTPLSAEDLLKSILAVEAKMGRIRQLKYGPRLIDIDILLYNDVIINKEGLQIPHPQLQNRRFALAPLAEIEPAKLHPQLKKTIAELLEICPDELDVYKMQ